MYMDMCSIHRCDEEITQVDGAGGGDIDLRKVCGSGPLPKTNSTAMQYPTPLRSDNVLIGTMQAIK